MALVPVTAAAIGRPELRPLAALLAHQTEEWVWPGGFLPWINRDVLGSDTDEFPIDRRAGFIINVGFGWGLSLSTLAGPGAAAPQAMLYASHIGNAGLHIGWAVRNRRFDPGLATGALALLPVGICGLRKLARDPEVSRRRLGAGVVAGVAFAAGMAPFFKARLKRARG
ncbi:MAG: HXXEE domain-containing protein [Solirubrobacterales bacterium]|nr:HXXEE domain-containing protein [Solirubrobacterales bacterium]